MRAPVFKSEVPVTCKIRIVDKDDIDITIRLAKRLVAAARL